MAAKLATITFNAANMAALKVLIDAWLVGGAVVQSIWFNNAMTDCIIYYYV
jgi:hypothetical protein